MILLERESCQRAFNPPSSMSLSAGQDKTTIMVRSSYVAIAHVYWIGSRDHRDISFSSFSISTMTGDITLPCRGQPDASNSRAEKCSSLHGCQNQAREGTYHCRHSRYDPSGIAIGLGFIATKSVHQSVVLHWNRTSQRQDRTCASQSL
jgi:hypothetical protein